MEKFDSTNKLDGTTWISIVDAITALFFVFLILFIVTILLKNKPEYEFMASVSNIIEGLDSMGYETYGQKIEFGDEGFFQSGETELSVNARDTLKTLALSIKEEFIQNEQLVMVVIGHTDSIPITKSKYSKIDDNWDLSVLRAKSTREYLVKVCKLPSERVLPAGYADQLPKAPNFNKEGRSKNRRIELFLTHQKSIGAKQWTYD